MYSITIFGQTSKSDLIALICFWYSKHYSAALWFGSFGKLGLSFGIFFTYIIISSENFPLAHEYFIIILLEVYRFLSSEVRAYLPSYETVTVWHLRDLAMGVKQIINCDNVKVIDVPQFEGLAIQDIFSFAQNDRDVERALPPSKEITKLSRAYLANVVYTIMGQNF